MRVKNLGILAIFLFALLLLPSVKAYTTDTDQEWYYGYFPDGGTTNGSEIIDCDKSYLIDNNILDINASWDILVCLKKTIALKKYAVIVANYSGQYRGLLLNHTKLYMRDFERTSFVNVTSALNYTVLKGDVLVSTKSYTGKDYRNFVVLDINTTRDHPSYPQSCWGVLKGFFVMVDMGDLLSCPKTFPLCGKFLGFWQNRWEYYLLWAGIGRTIAPSYCHPYDFFNILTDYGEYPSALVDEGWIRPLYLSPVTLVGSAYLPTAIQPYRWWIVQKSSGTVYGRITPFATDRSFWLKPTFCTLGDFEGTYTQLFTKENSESLYWYYQQTGQEWQLWVNYADPISLENTNSSLLPSPTPNATQIEYFQQGVEANRRWCPITNTYYWVNYSATFSKVVKYYPVNIIVNYFNMVGGGWSAPDDSLTATIECSIEGWEDSYTFANTGSFYTLQTTCLFNNKVTISGGNYIPSYHQIIDYDIPVDCPTTSLMFEVLKPYDVTITVRERVEGDPIVGVNVTLDENSDFTNGDGQVTFTINPYISSFLGEVYGYPHCTRKFVVDGIPEVFTVIVNKIGYRYTSESVSFADADWNGDYSHLYKTATIYMDEISTKVNIHLKTNDGIEFYPKTATIYAYDGNLGIKYAYKGKVYPQSLGYSFPARFIFYDNRSTFNTTFSIHYAGSIYNKTYEVELNGDYDFDLYIDKSSGQLPCENIADCPDSFCKTNFYNKLIGCISDICTFTEKECALCDDLIGCYSYVPPEPISCTYDEDCEELNYCDNNITSVQGLCGSEGECLIKRVLCPDYCDPNTGLCHYYEVCNVWRPASFWIIDGIPTGETESINLYEQQYKCGLDNVGTTTCFSGMNISKADYSTIGYNSPQENAWISETIGTGASQYTRFYDYSIYCDYECEMVIGYCQYGCSITTGKCLGKPDTWESQAGNWVNSIGMAIASIFPTPIHRNIFSIIIMVIVGVGAGYLTKQPIAGGLGMFAFCLMFLAIGWLPAWIIFIFIVLGAFAVYKMMWGE